MYIEVDVEKEIADSIKKAMSGDLIANAIESRISNMIQNIINEQIAPYSDFGNMIRKVIKAELPTTCSIDNQSNFRDMILKIVESNIAEYRDKQLEARLNELMSGLLQKAPESIKLSELIRQAANMWGVSEPSVHIEVSAGIVAGYTNVYLDKEKNKGKYSCSCSIAISDKGGVYSVKIHNQDLRDSMFVGPFYEFERFLFWLYTGGTTVEIDVDEPDEIDLSEFGKGEED